MQGTVPFTLNLNAPSASLALSYEVSGRETTLCSTCWHTIGGRWRYAVWPLLYLVQWCSSSRVSHC